jgi:hypothetical protein
MPDHHVSLVMCQRAEPGQELNDAEAEPVTVETFAGACLLVLDCGTKLAFEKGELVAALGVRVDEAEAA